MDKEALLGTGLKTAFTAAKKAFNLKKGGTLNKLKSSGRSGIHSLAKTHKYKGDMGGMLTRGRDGYANGLTNTGKVVGGMGLAGATGYAAG